MRKTLLAIGAALFFCSLITSIVVAEPPKEKSKYPSEEMIGNALGKLFLNNLPVIIVAIGFVYEQRNQTNQVKLKIDAALAYYGEQFKTIQAKLEELDKNHREDITELRKRTSKIDRAVVKMVETVNADLSDRGKKPITGFLELDDF